MNHIFSHKYLVVLAFLFLGFIACTNSENSTHPSSRSENVYQLDSSESKAIIDLNQTSTDTLELQIGCYYKLDNKYAESEDTSVINSWWQNKLIEIANNGFQNNLFENDGGGPNGAHWNSSTDLYIAASINEKLNDEVIQVELNKKKITGLTVLKYFPTDKIGTIVYFKLPKNIWEKHLRKITPSDFEDLYGKENLENSNAPLEIGEVIEIRLNIQNSNSNMITLTDYFHVAFGE